jgi:TatD DNase family protein
MLIDTHAHLFDDRFRSDLPAVLQRAKAAGIERVVCLGIDRESSLATIEIAKSHPLVAAAVGIQPNNVAEAQPGDWDEVVRLAETVPSVVAIGETGLDRYWDRTPFDQQEEMFARHIELAGMKVKTNVKQSSDDAASVVSNEP